MNRSRSWKDNVNMNTKKKRNAKRYGKRNASKYNTLFMVADEIIFGKEED